MKTKIVVRDISHFRAPFKDAPYLGMGGVGAMNGFGAVNISPRTISKQMALKNASSLRTSQPQLVRGSFDTAAVSSVSNPAAAAETPVYVTASNGSYKEFRPEAAKPILEALVAFVIVMEGNDDAISLHVAQPNDVRESAVGWVNRKLIEGKAVVAGSMAGIDSFPLTLFTATEATPHILYAVANSDAVIADAAPADGKVSALLVRPSTDGASIVANKAGMSPAKKIAIAVGVVAAVAGLAYVAKKRK